MEKGLQKPSVSEKQQRVKVKVYKTVLRAVFIYGLETAALIKKHEAELEVAELFTFSLGVTKMDRVRGKTS